MPNLQQLIALREKYSTKSNVSLRQIKLLNERFNLSTNDIKNAFVREGVSDSIIEYFEAQKSTDVVLLFIDITGFSNICSYFSNSLLASYLDQYYATIIPIIYHHGGEIEKIIGDGIICVFGEPFLTSSKFDLLSKAEKCAKDILIVSKGSHREVKIAYHDGEIMYYKNKSLNYPEYTIIGKPLTELFRLESVAKNNSLSFYSVSPYDSMLTSQSGAYCLDFSSKIECKYFTKSNNETVSLQGVRLTQIRHLTC